MYARILIPIAASTIAIAAAHAQGTGTSSGTTAPSTTAPGTTGTMPSTAPSTGTPSTGAVGTTRSGTMGSGTMGSGTTGAPSQAQSGSFNASNYKTKTECLNAAQAARMSSDACNGVK
jgi:hypothetical protein